MIIQQKDPQQETSWAATYGQRHRLERITDFPKGIIPPKKVRIYWRLDHYVLQWWDPREKRNLPDRVDGDLVAAITRARQIEERLEHFKTSGKGRRHLGHRELVELFVGNLHQRANAGELDPRTVPRYESALSHYLRFAEQLMIETAFGSATGVNREFVRLMATFLGNCEVSGNGHPHSQRRKMVGVRYVEDVVRAMFTWAQDPDGGNLLPDGFRNPFQGYRRNAVTAAPDPFGEPDITTEMAATLLAGCDSFQLPLFALLSLYGLRAAEPGFVFREHLKAGWLSVACDPALAFWTKGRRSKRLPLLEVFESLWTPTLLEKPGGLLFLRRSVVEGRERPPLLGATLSELHGEFQRRCGSRALTATERTLARNQLLKQAGCLTYDQIELEFQRLTVRLNWPKAATLKDLRHLFSTALQNAGMPEYYRKYLMGHAPGNAAIVNYTHLNQLREKYTSAVSEQLQPVVNAVKLRASQLKSVI